MNQPSPRPRPVLLLLAICAILALAPTVVSAQISQPEPEYSGNDRIEEWQGKKILVVTPHPDDETFTSGGTLALLANRGNDIHVVIYTTDNAGSKDPTMTHDRLKAIRKAEEENACRILGIPIENLTWLGHDDGMLEYADKRELTKQVAQQIRRVRPDALFSIDPGSPYMQYHKSDHRSAAVITVDAIRAARWRLYFPELDEAGFKAFDVPLVFFYYSANPNYGVDITSVVERKSRAAASHTSQFGSLTEKYDAKLITDQHLETLAQSILDRAVKASRDQGNGGKVIERFRRSTNY